MFNNLYHRIRRTRDLAKLRRINQLLSDELEVQKLKVDALTAMLADSRTYHGRELQKVAELERQLGEALERLELYRSAQWAGIAAQIED